MVHSDDAGSPTGCEMACFSTTLFGLGTYFSHLGSYNIYLKYTCCLSCAFQRCWASGTQRVVCFQACVAVVSPESFFFC